MRFFLTALALTILGIGSIAQTYAQTEAETKAEAETEQTAETYESNNDYERKLELAQRMHEIWPLRLKIESALNTAAEKVPADERLRFKAAMRQAIKFNVMEEESINAMVKLFTVAELEKMAEFYGSPEGRAISAKTDDYQNLMRPVYTRMLDKALMDIRMGSNPGNFR